MSNFTVVLTSEAGSPYPIASKSENTEKAAIKKAEDWASEHPDKLVFIEYFRSNDGQKGYINRDGFDITGKSWTDV